MLSPVRPASTSYSHGKPAGSQPSGQSFSDVLAQANQPGKDLYENRQPESSPPEPSSHEKLLAELAEYMKKTPIEHLRNQILKAMDLTEADLEKMDAKDRQSIEDEIARRIRGKIEEQARTES